MLLRQDAGHQQRHQALNGQVVQQLVHDAALGNDAALLLDAVDVWPLLHGVIAARILPERYPELPPEVWHAIAVHTTAAVEMSPLDEVIFVADGIEPLRHDTPGIERTRSLVGKVSLDDLFWESFVGGIVYVLEGARHLYPGTVDVYNGLVAHRAERERKNKETA